MNPCARPLSWLALERYALGDVEADERRRLDAHLHACAHCRRDLDAILSDPRTLPPPTPRPQTAGAGRRRRVWLAFGGLAGLSAACLILGLFWFASPAAPSRPPSRIGLKGGDLAISAIRERGGRTLADPPTYLPGDRLSLRVTCPPGLALDGELIVFEAGQAHFPSPRLRPVPTGNRRALPGALRLSGRTDVLVCLVTGADLPPREALAGLTTDTLPAGSVCVHLEPAAP